MLQTKMATTLKTLLLTSVSEHARTWCAWGPAVGVSTRRWDGVPGKQGHSAAAAGDPACSPCEHRSGCDTRRHIPWDGAAHLHIAHLPWLHCSRQCCGAACEGTPRSSLPAERDIGTSTALMGSWQKPPVQNFQVENEGTVQVKNFVRFTLWTLCRLFPASRSSIAELQRPRTRQPLPPARVQCWHSEHWRK